MCKRNSPDKNEASTGCVRETPQIKRERQKQKQKQKRDKSKKNKQPKNGICKRNSPNKNKPARDV